MADKKRRRQHSKGNKSARPRAWHHGRAQGKVDEKKLLRAEPAFVKAADDQAQVAATAADHRERTGDWQECLAQLDRASPYVPAWDFTL